MKRWMNLFFLLWGRLVPLRPLPKMVLISRPWKNVSAATFEKHPVGLLYLGGQA